MVKENNTTTNRTKMGFCNYIKFSMCLYVSLLCQRTDTSIAHTAFFSILFYSDKSKLEILYFVFSMVLLTNIDFSMSKGSLNMVKATRGSKYC